MQLKMEMLVLEKKKSLHEKGEKISDSSFNFWKLEKAHQNKTRVSQRYK